MILTQETTNVYLQLSQSHELRRVLFDAALQSATSFCIFLLAKSVVSIPACVASAVDDVKI